MTVSGILEIVGAAGAAIAIAALVIILLLQRRVKKLQRDQRVILGSRGETDLMAYIANLEQKQNHLREAVEALTMEAKDHEVRIDGCVSRMGMVRFDAYHDLGGRQSSVVALLDALDNGMVITTVVSREFARIYVKALHEGQPDIILSPEEAEAVEQACAKGNAPFTVRPRQQGKKEEEALSSQEIDEETHALVRENRRRRRQGLPALETLPPAPSTLGWPTIERPPAQSEPGEIGASDDETRELAPVKEAARDYEL